MTNRTFLGARAVRSLLPVAHAAEPAGGVIPDFSGLWQHGVPQIVFHPIPGAPASPVIDVQDMACTPNCPPRPPGRLFVGDHTNKNLTPAGAAAVRRMGERWRSGEIVNAATEICAPSGVPHVITLLGPVQFLQTPDLVTILYQRDHQVRFVWMNRPHTARPKPSWYGESVGHYEGDTLVIETTGLNDKSIIDRFGAPQTERTRVTERYRISDDRRTLVAHVTVEDPGIFVAPWSGTITYTRSNQPHINEERCAENNREATPTGVMPIPIDDSPDF
jgi:hypothetical protein